MISTPNAPGSLFEAIEKEHEEASVFEALESYICEKLMMMNYIILKFMLKSFLNVSYPLSNVTKQLTLAFSAIKACWISR